MGKLNQVIACVAGKKQNATKTITEAYHLIQKAPLFDGISRTYRPKTEEGDTLPAETKAIQVKVGTLVGAVKGVLAEMFDVVATQDVANTKARADVVVEGRVIVKDVPVTHLLFLEKQSNDLATFIGKLPVLDPSESWEYNEASDQWATAPSETARTKKVPKAFVKSPATVQHPAQVEMFTEDELAGYWKTVKFSGAIPAKERNDMLDRVRKLHEAIVKAREEANGIDAPTVKVGESVLGYVFGE